MKDMTGIHLGEWGPRALLPSLALLICLSLSMSPLSAQQFVDQTAARLPAQNEYSSQVAIADVDNDGDLDLAFANGRGFFSAQLQEQVRLYINNGNGIFTDQSIARLGVLTEYGRDVEFGDVDRDGDMDMIVANDFATPALLLINDGTGNFTDESAARIPGLSLGSAHACFGDVENDGDLDIWITNGGASRFSAGQPQLWRNDGNGFFTQSTGASVPIANVSEQMDCLFGDIDGDFDLDMVGGNRAGNSRLYENDGNGVFTDVTAGRLPPDNNTYSYDFGDLDGDGDLDLLGINSAPNNSREALFINDGAGTFTNESPTRLPGANNPQIDDNDSKFIDFDNDGDLDFIIAALGGSGERAYVNNGGVFTLTSGIITQVADSSLDIEFGDLDGDGDLDMVTAQGESGGFQNRIYMNMGPADTLPPTFPNFEQLADTTDTTGPYPVRVVIRDSMTSDKNFFLNSAEISYTVNGGPAQTVPLHWMGHDIYRAEIPGAASGGTIEYQAVATDFNGNTGTSSTLMFEVMGPMDTFDRGDCNNDGNFDLADAIQILGYLFPSAMPVVLACEDSCDGNDDGSLDVSDTITLLLQLFPAGPPPGLPAPFGACGVDPTSDTLACPGPVSGCP